MPTGTTVTVREPGAPDVVLNVMLALGTSVVFEDPALNVTVWFSTSETVNAIPPVVPSSAMVRLEGRPESEGASLFDTTVNTNDVDAVAPAGLSVTVKDKVVEPNRFGAGVTVSVRAELEATAFTGLMLTLPVGTKVVLEDPKLTATESVLSLSATVNVKELSVPSSEIERFAIVDTVGTSFWDVTLTTKELVADVVAESRTVSVSVAVPNWFAAGVTVKERAVVVATATELVIDTLATGTSVVFEDVAVTVNVSPGSASVTVKPRLPVATSSFTVWGPMVVMVGVSFTLLNVTVNVVVEDLLFASVLLPLPVPLSRTVSVTVTVPVRSGAERTVKERADVLATAVPFVSVMLPSGMIVWLDEAAVTVSVSPDSTS